MHRWRSRKLLLEHGADPNAGLPLAGVAVALHRADRRLRPRRRRPATTSEPARAGPAAARRRRRSERQPDHVQLRSRVLPRRTTTMHLELLLEFGLGQGDGGPWHERMTTAHPTPQQLLEDELVFASSAGLLHRVELVLAQGIDPDGRGTEHPGLRRTPRVRAGRRPRAHRDRRAAARSWCGAAGRGPRGLRRGHARRDARDQTRELAARAVARNPHLPFRAAEIGRTEALEPLKDLGFDLNLVPGDPRRSTRPRSTGHLDTVKKLIELGADPSMRDPSYDGNALGWAEHNHQQMTASRLISTYLKGLPPGRGTR